MPAPRPKHGKTINVPVIAKFNRLWNDNPSARLFAIYGGAGSGKSVAVAQRICRILIWGKGAEILVTRKTLPSLRITAYKMIRDTLDAWQIPYEHNKSERIISIGQNRCYFSGMDNPEKIKSAEFNYVWMEEATDFKRDDLMQINLRVRRRNPGPWPNQIYMSFNPIDAHHWLIEDYVEGPKKRNIVIHHSTYQDNPYLPPEYVEELEDLINRDENFYRIYSLGQPGVLKNKIYTNYTVEDFPAPVGLFVRDADFMGLDFGFNNQTALVAIRIINGDPYIKELFYADHYTNGDLVEWMRANLHNKNIPIYADSAEPDRITEIARAGFNIHPARKEVVPGIDHVKSMHLHIDRSSPNLITEIQNYKWKEDKEGNVLDEPVKFRDHAMDAMRYGLWSANIGGTTVPMDAATAGKYAPDAGLAAIDYGEEEDDPELWI